MIEDQRDMRKLRRFKRQGLIEFHMFGGICQMVLAPDYVRNSHLDIVHHIYEMEYPRAVRAPERHVRIETPIEFNATANDIIDHDGFMCGTKPKRTLIVVDRAFGLEDGEIFFVNRVPLTLKIRAVVSTNAGSFFPIQSEPVQTVIYHLHSLFALPAFIRVFDSEDKRSVVVPG